MCWIPNALTLPRLLLLLPVILPFATGTPAALWRALALFLAASVTDALDGWAERRLDCAGNIGISPDQLADKIFAKVLLVYLASRHPDWLPLWPLLALFRCICRPQSGFGPGYPCLTRYSLIYGNVVSMLPAGS